MIISVASGKGGTGKTTVSTSLALSIGKDAQILDCDVEEPNAHIFIKPKIEKKESVSIPVPKIDESKCVFCGKCQEACVYNVIAVIPATSERSGKTLTFQELCHGCGACSYLCPVGAIKEVPRETGIIEMGYAGDLEFIHGRLNIGEAMAPPLIREVKKKIDKNKTVIIDAPPGTSCPVITSIQGSDYCLLVTEPTPFGLNDLVLAVEVLKEMNVPFGVVINRADLGDSKTEEYCEKENIPILMRVPFNKEIAQSYSKGIPIIEGMPEYKRSFEELLKKIKEEMKK
ncbi:MAG: ATP-binding protein [Candidatus Aadella gelida]|nr:ATP-binding protein [Candidatus Aadella gelida]